MPGMTEPNPNTLRVWEGWLPAPSTGSAALLSDRPLPPLPFDPATADRLFAQEALFNDGPPRETAERFSLQWFLGAETARHHRYGKWLPKLLEFAKHGGERLLGLGYGLGTDWVQYARHGAEVIACSPSADHLAIVQRNFRLRAALRATVTGSTPCPRGCRWRRRRSTWLASTIFCMT